MRHVNIPIFIPELACPFQCIFCNQQQISGHGRLPSEKEIRETITAHVKTTSSETKLQLAFFGGSFTALSLSEQERLLDIPQEFIQKGIISGIRLSTRPDYISREVLLLLKKKKVTAIELGAQSLIEEVLQKSGRGHTVLDVKRASTMILEEGFELGLQMMLGLPADSKEKAIQTAKKIVAFGAHTTRIYPCLVIKDTALAKLYLKGRYTPLTIEEAVEQTKEIMKVLENGGVQILRIGLHPSEGLLNGEAFIAGPFHTNFSEMVQSSLCMSHIVECINAIPINKQTQHIEIITHPKQFNFAVGYKAKNKSELSRRYQSVKFTLEKDIKEKCRIKFR